MRKLLGLLNVYYAPLLLGIIGFIAHQVWEMNARGELMEWRVTQLEAVTGQLTREHKEMYSLIYGKKPEEPQKHSPQPRYVLPNKAPTETRKEEL